MLKFRSLSLIKSSLTKAINKESRIIWNVFFHIVCIGDFYPIKMRMCRFDELEETYVVGRRILRLVVGFFYDNFNVDDLKTFPAITVLKGLEGIAIKCTHFFQIIQ